jgi:hypothetical protein
MEVFLLLVVIAVIIIVFVNKAKREKRAEVQKKASEELKNSNNYAFALRIYEALEKENRKEPYIGFNFNHDHQAYAEFTTAIKEAGNSTLTIHTTEFAFEHKDKTNKLVRFYGDNCVLDMGMTLIYSSNTSQEMINLLKGLATVYCIESNLYVYGKLVERGSNSLPIYPMEVSEFTYEDVQYR